MHNQIKLILSGLCDPSAGAGAVVLDFDDVFFEDKACAEEAFHDAEGEGDKVAAAAGVAHQNHAMAAGLEDAEELAGGLRGV